MTENKALESALKKVIAQEKSNWGYIENFDVDENWAVRTAIEQVQQYRAIGTPEECLAAVEKQTVMKPIRMDKCTCPSCGTHNEVWKKRRNTVPSDIVYCWHCGQAVEIFRGDEQ